MKPAAVVLAFHRSDSRRSRADLRLTAYGIASNHASVSRFVLQASPLVTCSDNDVLAQRIGNCVSRSTQVAWRLEKALTQRDGNKAAGSAAARKFVVATETDFYRLVKALAAAVEAGTDPGSLQADWDRSTASAALRAFDDHANLRAASSVELQNAAVARRWLVRFLFPKAAKEASI